nr:hypothetical protein [Pandoravirus belohorizontensis]
MSSPSESVIDNQNNSAAPTETCSQTGSAQTAGAGPTAEIVDAHDCLEEKAGDAVESSLAPESTSPDSVQPPSSDSKASGGDTASNQTDAGDAPTDQGEKRKEPDALVDAPTQDDSVGGDAEAAPAKKQKIDDDAGTEPTPAAPSVSSE